jgi:hypothetical protein
VTSSFLKRRPGGSGLPGESRFIYCCSCPFPSVPSRSLPFLPVPVRSRPPHYGW